jgi:8-amino-7-oxononanoate synthase
MTLRQRCMDWWGSVGQHVRDMSLRTAYKIGVSVRSRIGAAAQTNADACAGVTQRRSGTGRRPVSMQFSDHPLYASIAKHMALPLLFKFSNPFYRCHEAQHGVETVMAGKTYINFASYDYLGLNQHCAVKNAAKDAIDCYGTSVSASRIVAGERPLHGHLEAELAALYEAESAVAFVSGHATNVSTIGTLMSADDVIIYDELCHNSVMVGNKLSRATARSFKHNDMSALEKVLAECRPHHARALVVVEGLYSMDGDIAPLPDIVHLKRQFNAWLMVDEAHALGVLGAKGKGTAEHWGIDPREVDIWMGTLSKALAACGGYIAGRRELVKILKYQAPGLVYSVGLSPPLAAAAYEALQIMGREPERVARLQKNGQLFLSLCRDAGFNTSTSEGYAIVSIIVGDILSGGRLSDRLLDRGLNVLPIIFPAVPLKSTRFRFFITSEHTEAQIRNAVRIMGEELAMPGRKQVA